VTLGSPLRTAVVGTGLIAQAMHLPYLAAMRDRFELVALVDPVPGVRDALAARYGVGETFGEVTSLLDAGVGAEAAIVCAPNAAHVEIVTAALDAGLHVLVEKPLCLTLEHADAIIAARDRANRVVQVGYMNRFDPAVERMREELPNSVAGLRYVSVEVRDPEHWPYLGPGELVRGALPAEVAGELCEAERAQVEAAVGATGDEAVTAYSEGYLGSLIHQVNLVHALLESMGESLPATVIGGDRWAGGDGLAGSVRLSNGARWDSVRIQLLDVPDYGERVALIFEDSVRTLSFPSPYLKQAPTLYEHVGPEAEGTASRIYRAHGEGYQRQLVHFHDCIVDGAPCRTSADQARIDIEVMIEIFRASSRIALRQPAEAGER
jgi:predicted dehydrogenase